MACSPCNHPSAEAVMKYITSYHNPGGMIIWWLILQWFLTFSLNYCLPSIIIIMPQYDWLHFMALLVHPLPCCHGDTISISCGQSDINSNYYCIVCLSVCLSVCMSVCVCLYVCPYVCRYVCMYICLSVCASVCAYTYVCPYVRQSVYVCVCVFMRPSVCVCSVIRKIPVIQ